MSRQQGKKAKLMVKPKSVQNDMADMLTKPAESSNVIAHPLPVWQYSYPD